MRRWNNFFLPAFLGIALITTGCFSSVSGNAKIADASYTMKLVKGKTTEQEAIALLVCCVNENGTFLVCTDQAERVS